MSISLKLHFQILSHSCYSFLARILCYNLTDLFNFFGIYCIVHEEPKGETKTKIAVITPTVIFIVVSVLLVCYYNCRSFTSIEGKTICLHKSYFDNVLELLQNCKVCKKLPLVTLEKNRLICSF